jgi:hypothetical protein
MLVALIETSSTKVAKAIAAQGANRRVNAHRAALESVLNEARELRKTLLMVRSVLYFDAEKRLLSRRRLC